MGDLSFKQFAAVARSRAERWFPINDWSGSDWATALAGETGEVCDVIKKLNRADIGKPSHKDPPREVLLSDLGDELADVMTYANLLAHRYGIDLAEATAKKFNAVSEREGFPERIELTPDPVLDLTVGKKAVSLSRQVEVEAGHDLEHDLEPPMPEAAVFFTLLAHVRDAGEPDRGSQRV